MHPSTDTLTELEELYMDQVSLLNLIWEANMDATEKSGDEVRVINWDNGGLWQKPYLVKEVVSNNPCNGDNAVGKCIHFRFEQLWYGVSPSFPHLLI